ncbi:MAG: RagB/SusD family nutrient uptake outer membrane protein [Bacteroidota bacterium]
MKYIIKIFIFLNVLTIVSCTKTLEVEPQQSIDFENAIENTEDVNAAVVGCYSILGTGSLYGTNMFMLADLQASEGYCSWRGTFQGQRQVSTKTMTADNSEASRVWVSAYRGINNANLVLSYLNKVSDPDLKKQFEGEARFIRGILHFELVRYYALPWGATGDNSHIGVVVKTTPTSNETIASKSLPRNTVAQTYQQIISDLEAAADLLPEENGTRVTKYAALAFLSRVYLQQKAYDKARDAANEVIESGYYALNASVAAVFSNKNTKESIWEIQQNEQNNAGQTNDGMATFFASLVGIGRADVRVTASYLTSNYNPADLRLTEWFYIGVGARPGNRYCGKWKDFAQNLPVVRIAEMYLTRAECNNRLGTSVGDSPENDLRMVRNPLRTNTDITLPVTLNDILKEREIELAFEGVRIHDFKRLEKSTGTFPWNSPKLVFPIPRREVDATSGVIAQNPGY